MSKYSMRLQGTFSQCDVMEFEGAITDYAKKVFVTKAEKLIEEMKKTIDTPQLQLIITLRDEDTDEIIYQCGYDADTEDDTE